MKITGIGRRFGLFCMIALVFTGGCTTSVMQSTPALPGQQSEGGNPVVTNLKAANTGFYLLYWIPLWSGSVSFPNHGAYNLFSDNLEDKYMFRMLDRQCAKDNADGVEDVRLREDVSGWVGLGIVWKKTLHASAVTVKRQ